MNCLTYEGKNLEELKEKSLEQINLNSNDVIMSWEEKKFGLFKSAITYTLKIYKLNDVVSEIKDYLLELLNNMHIHATCETKIRENQINIKIFSNQNNILIGKNGQNLNALQTIIRQHIFKEIGTYPYLILDVENYKEKRI